MIHFPHLFKSFPSFPHISQSGKTFSSFPEKCILQHYISPILLNIYYFPPTLINFVEFTYFYLGPTLRVFLSPYFDHDAFTHHRPTLQAGLLDARGQATCISESTTQHSVM